MASLCAGILVLLALLNNAMSFNHHRYQYTTPMHYRDRYRYDYTTPTYSHNAPVYCSKLSNPKKYYEMTTRLAECWKKVEGFITKPGMKCSAVQSYRHCALQARYICDDKFTVDYYVKKIEQEHGTDCMSMYYAEPDSASAIVCNGATVLAAFILAKLM